MRRGLCLRRLKEPTTRAERRGELGSALGAEEGADSPSAGYLHSAQPDCPPPRCSLHTSAQAIIKTCRRAGWLVAYLRVGGALPEGAHHFRWVAWHRWGTAAWCPARSASTQGRPVVEVLGGVSESQSQAPIPRSPRQRERAGKTLGEKANSAPAGTGGWLPGWSRAAAGSQLVQLVQLTGWAGAGRPWTRRRLWHRVLPAARRWLPLARLGLAAAAQRA